MRTSNPRLKAPGRPDRAALEPGSNVCPRAASAPVTRRSRSALAGLVGLVLIAACGGPPEVTESPPDVLLIVADDMSWDTPGCYGGDAPEITPNIDRLAGEGLRYARAYVNVSVCRPSRMALLTGRYPHRSGGQGFGDLTVPDVPHLPALLRECGYRVGVLGKLQHSTPYADFEWDLAVGRKELGMGRSPRRFAEEARRFIRDARAAGRPFFLMANSHDPHRPLAGMDPQAWYADPAAPAERPSRAYAAGDAALPGFLPDLPVVRAELAAYLASVRRCDDTVGALLGVLEELGAVETTLVVFLSDNGMPFPFAKASCYPAGTRVPWLVRWPGHTQPGSVSERLVLGVDLAASLLGAAGAPRAEGLQGEDLFAPPSAADGGPRRSIFVQYDESATGGWYPMRGVYSGDLAYVVNLWSNGARVFERPEQEVNGAYLALERAAQDDAALAARLESLQRRTLEELYDTARDPDCLRNLAADPAHADDLERLRAEAERWMRESGDPALEAYLRRDERAVRDAFVDGLGAGTPR